ncbi:MAG: AI-2E family transporter, partial [Calditrichae bacterium]|nr:AI-2E family transporter [Calditrichia bacterium]
GMSRAIKILLFLLVLTGVVAFLFSVGDLVKLMIISILFAYVLDPLVTFIESKGINRAFSTLILFICIAAVLTLMLIFLLPAIKGEIDSLREGFNQEKTAVLIERAEAFIMNTLSFFGIQDMNLTEKLAQSVVGYGNSIFKSLLGAISLITKLILAPFVIFFLLKDWRDIKKLFVSLVPNRYFEFTLNLLWKMDNQLGNYFRGQIVDALIIGILSMAAMFILEVRYAVIIGTFAGIANLIPYVGPVSGALLAIFISFLQTGDIMLLLQIAIAFAIVQLIDNVVVQPAVVAKTVNLPPLVVLLVVLIGGKFFGILGMLLSIPITLIIKVSVEEGAKI